MDLTRGLAMSDVERDSGTDPVLGRLAPRWSAERTEENLAMTFQRIEHRRRVAWVGGAAGLVAGAAALAFVWTSRAPRTEPVVAQATPPAATSPAPLVLDDGSTVVLADARARVRVASTTPERLELALDGAASFTVPARAHRAVVVKTTRVEVTILAASFKLAPEGDGARIDVASGSVDVTWPGGGHATLGAGASEVVPTPAPAAVAPEAPAPAEAPKREKFLLRVAHRDYAGAYRMLVANPSLADHSPEGLLRAADAARLSGHPAASVPYYERVLRDFPRDERAPVAAFTLGRILLTQLDRPGAAADAFATSRRLAPAGALATDAWAREIEAATRAGDGARAKDLARGFLAKHGDDPHAAAVRRAAGLE
jgi:transmembrane sensor